MRDSKKRFSDKKIKDYYEDVARKKGDADNYWAKGFFQSLLIEKIELLLKDVNKKNVLDIGCGDGRVTAYLSLNHNKIVGMDIAYTRLLRAKQKILSASTSSLFLQSYAETQLFKENTFDLVVCTEVLEHVQDDDALIKSISYYLKDDGLAIISIPTVSLSRYTDMYKFKRPIYFDPVEHLREYAYYRIPWFKNDFVKIRYLIDKYNKYGLTVKKKYGVGFELPLAVKRYLLGRLIEKCVRKKKINRILSAMPILRKLCVYTVFVLKK